MDPRSHTWVLLVEYGTYRTYSIWLSGGRTKFKNNLLTSQYCCHGNSSCFDRKVLRNKNTANTQAYAALHICKQQRSSVNAGISCCRSRHSVRPWSRLLQSLPESRWGIHHDFRVRGGLSHDKYYYGGP